MLKLALKYYHTLKYLQWTQVKHRLLYKLSSSVVPVSVPKELNTKSETLFAQTSMSAEQSLLSLNTFIFLNIEHQFKNGIDWNFSAYGKLWTYNLTYFDFLSQLDISKKQGIDLIQDFIKKIVIIEDGMEPFPISLRCMNWIKFLSKHQIEDSQINQSLYQQLYILSKRPEYHLLGNHLLENSFSLLFGAFYFNDDSLFQQAKTILITQLNEQVLADGAHFELSPMYHQIMLFRVLDAINLFDNNTKITEANLYEVLSKKASIMLGWLKQIMFRNGLLPQVNDSVEGIAPSPQQLFEYAHKLGLEPKVNPLNECGYRMVRNASYEILVDVGQIGPDYIPGHAHSDTFNFVLQHQEQALIVDTAISTYEKNKQRNKERSTAAHNTVMIDGLEQSEVWGGFRVARRAGIIDLQEGINYIKATHNGYQKINSEHQRIFVFHENEIEITDQVSGKKEAKAFLHFHPNVRPEIKENQIIGTFGSIQFEGQYQLHLEPYVLAIGFNKTLESMKAVIAFSDKLHTKIKLNENIISNR